MMQRWRPAQRWVFLFAFALIMRLALLLGLQSSQHALATAHHEHESIARSLVLGQGFRFNFFGNIHHPDLTSQQAPLIPYLLAASYWLFGIETVQAAFCFLLLQCCLSAATATGLAWYVEQQIAHIHSPHEIRKWSLVTGLSATCYPPLLLVPLHIQAVCWNLAWLVGLLCLTHQLQSHRFSLWSMIAFIFIASAALYTDPILGLPIVVCLMYLGRTWAFSEGYAAAKNKLYFLVQSRLSLRLGWLVLGIALCLLPWTIRNYQVHGRLIFIKSSFWYVFWQGNNAISVGTDKLPVPVASAEQISATLNPLTAQRLANEVRQHSRSVNDLLTNTQIEQLQSLPGEIERMDQFRTWILADLTAHPGRYLWRCCQRANMWLGFDQTNPKSYLWPYRLSYFLLISFAAVGSWWLWREQPELASCQSLALVVWLVLSLTAVHVSIITSARFRLPFELFMLIPASYAICRLSTYYSILNKFTRPR